MTEHVTEHPIDAHLDPAAEGTPSRRAVALGGLAGAGGLGLALAGQASAGATGVGQAEPRPSDDSPVDRAHRAVMAIREHFSVTDGTDLLRERFPVTAEDPEYTYVWPLGQARFAATELSHARSCVPEDLSCFTAGLARAQTHYWHEAGGTTGLPGYTAATSSAEGAHGDYFYDDNDWIGLLEVQEHLMSGGCAGDIPRALQILELLRSGEDTDPTSPSPGGIRWTQAADQRTRNTVSTIPAAKLALRLHQITGEERALTDAIRWVDWARSTLLSPEDGLFWDNISPDGSIDRAYWAYNQGVPIGTFALLAEITGETVWRDRALDLVAASSAHYAPQTSGGGLDQQPLQFVAIHLQNLLLSEALLGEEVGGKRTVDAVADRWWHERTDQATGLYRGASHEGDTGTHLLDQAGLARVLALAALPRDLWRHLS